jgi:hypothetical protein
MDKLKMILAVAKKYQFWILCAVTLCVSLTCWWLATGALAAQTKGRSELIETDFKGVQIPPDSPNEESNKLVRSREGELKQKIDATWKDLYENQQKQGIYPTDFPGGEFEKQFKSLQPKGEPNQSLNFRERYSQYMKRNYLPKLKALIRVRQQVAAGGEGAAAGGAAAMMMPPRPDMPAPPAAPGAIGQGGESTGVVDWDDYGDLESKFDWSETPSTQAVLVAQESLGVYETLLQVIKRVNEGAVTQSRAAVKRIVAMKIAKDAVDAWQRGRESAAAAGPAAGPGPAEGPPPALAVGPAVGPGPMPSAPGAASGLTDQQLFDSRYVDEKGQALPAANPEYPYVNNPAEFKRMPVYLGFVMDQRKLPKLLVELANAPMPIDVRRVAVVGDSGAGQRTDAGGAPQEVGQYNVFVGIQAVMYIYVAPAAATPESAAAPGP